jgi:hypothetical protein
VTTLKELDLLRRLIGTQDLQGLADMREIVASVTGDTMAAAAALRLAFDFVGKHSPGNPYLTEPGKTIAAVLAKIDGEG